MANPPSTKQQQQQQAESQNKSLYVGDLDPKVTTADLFYTFSQKGKVTSVRVCCDLLTGSSLCYGYVNFLTHLEAANALSSLNHTSLKGKPMRIMWCERNPITRKSGAANLFVKNLDPRIDSARLESVFSKFGTVVSCKVCEDEKGKSKGFGFVQFDKEETATVARNALHDSLLEGKKLYVANFVKSSQRKLEFTNLYVKNLSQDFTEDGLKEKFSEFGNVTSAVIMKDSLGNSKGFGFVSFESPQEAKTAVEALNGTSLPGGQTLFVGRAQKKAERARTIHEDSAKWKALTVYVKNLDPTVDNELLESHFSSSWMKVTSAKVILSDRGTCRGFGFVTFSSPTAAYAASVTFHGSTLKGRPIYVALAEGGSCEPSNFSLHVKLSNPGFPYYPAAKSALPYSSFKPNIIQNDTWLSAPSDACSFRRQDFRRNNKLFHETTLLQRPGYGSVDGNLISCSTSSSTASNNPICKKLHLSVNQAQFGEQLRRGMEFKMKEPDLLKLSASRNSIMQIVKDALQEIADTKARTPKC